MKDTNTNQKPRIDRFGIPHYKGKLTISMPHGGSDERETVTIQLEDELSGTRFATVTIQKLEFVNALFSLACRPMEFSWIPGLVGCVAEHKTELVKWEYKFGLTDEEKQASKAAALAKFEVDGWKGRADYLGNHHRRNRDAYTVTFIRYLRDGKPVNFDGTPIADPFVKNEEALEELSEIVSFEKDSTAVEYMRGSPELPAYVRGLEKRLESIRKSAAPLVKFIRKFDEKPIRNLDDEFYCIHTGTKLQASLRLSALRRLRVEIEECGMEKRVSELEFTANGSDKKMANGPFPLPVGSRLFTKDGRQHGNAIIVSASFDEGVDGGMWLYNCITDFGSIIKRITYGEICGGWFLTDSYGKQSIADVYTWVKDRSGAGLDKKGDVL